MDRSNYLLALALQLASLAEDDYPDGLMLRLGGLSPDEWELVDRLALGLA